MTNIQNVQTPIISNLSFSIVFQYLSLLTVLNAPHGEEPRAPSHGISSWWRSPIIPAPLSTDLLRSWWPPSSCPVETCFFPVKKNSKSMHRAPYQTYQIWKTHTVEVSDMTSCDILIFIHKRCIFQKGEDSSKMIKVTRESCNPLAPVWPWDCTGWKLQQSQLTRCCIYMTYTCLTILCCYGSTNLDNQHQTATRVPNKRHTNMVVGDVY